MAPARAHTRVPNEKCVVSPDAPKHAGRVGYFQMLGTRDNESIAIAILTEKPMQKGSDTGSFFAVEEKHLSPMKD